MVVGAELARPLFLPQGIQRIEPGRAMSGHEAGDRSDDGRHRDGQRDGAGIPGPDAPGSRLLTADS